MTMTSTELPNSDKQLEDELLRELIVQVVLDTKQAGIELRQSRQEMNREEDQRVYRHLLQLANAYVFKAR